MTRLPRLRRRRWRNHTGNQQVDPVEIRKPKSIAELREAVQEACEAGLTVRAVGSGHSWSDVAITTGYLIEPHGLSRVEHLDPSLVGAGVDVAKLVRVGSGTRLRELNEWLDDRGLGLIQMGGYDGQTLAGVVSTSTHGSGIGFGPFPDFVRSIDLVDGTGQARRIEPAGGITDRASFERALPGWQLTQNDDCFHAVVCGMGCMGLLVALVIEVRDRFELTEVRELRRWEDVREEIRSPLEQGLLGHNRYCEIYINPYSTWGMSNLCIVTRRNYPLSPGGPRHRPLIPELFGKAPWLTSAIMGFAGAVAPWSFPYILDYTLWQIKCRSYTNVSYNVFNIGAINKARAYSGEMAVPTDDNTHIRAVETLIKTAAAYAADGGIYHTSPVSLRFVKASPAMMSMMQGRQTMMIELIQIVDTDGGEEIIAAHEEALAPLGVRPHWGQINRLSAAKLRSSYPLFNDWDRIRRELDPKEVFASPFTKRVGITPRGVSS